MGFAYSNNGPLRPGQEALRAKIEAVVSSCCAEWSLCAYDVMGVLAVYQYQFMESLEENAEDEQDLEED